MPGTVLGTYYEMMNKIGIAPTFQPGNRPTIGSVQMTVSVLMKGREGGCDGVMLA